MMNFNTQDFPIKQSIAIIGGGLAGIVASIELSKYFQVHLIEKRSELGGNLVNIENIFTEGKIIPNPLINLIDFLHSTSNIDINLNSNIEDIEGNPGNYKINFLARNQIKKINVGAICICTGLSEKNIEKGDLYKNNVINQIEFINLIKSGKIDQNLDNKLIIFVNDLNDYEGINSSVVNTYSIVNALEAKKRGNEVIYLYKNINTPFVSENLYRMARDSGIQFIKSNFEIINDATSSSTNQLKIISDELNETFTPNYIVLSNLLVTNDSHDIIELLTEVSKTSKGYFKTLYNKLYQNETTQKGIFLAGSCIHPMSFSQVVQHARSASLSIYKFLKNERMEIESSWAEILEDKCVKCKNCLYICPYNAIKINCDEKNEIINIQTIPIRCRGCGLCSSVCPTDAIQLKVHSDEQIRNNLEKIFNDQKNKAKVEPLIIGYICMNCASFSLELAKNLNKNLDFNISCIPVSCAGKLSPVNLLEPLALGASGVFVLKCPETSCHFMDGSLKSENYIYFTKELLNSVEANHNRIEFIDLLTINYNVLEKRLTQFIKKIG